MVERAGRSRSIPANQYPHDPVGRVFEETAYGLEGIAAESRSGDANGQYIRVAAGGGTNTVKIPNALPAPTGGGLQDAVGLSTFPILGAMPRIERLGEDAVQARRAVRAPGAAEPRRPGSGSAPPRAGGQAPAARRRSAC